MAAAQQQFALRWHRHESTVVRSLPALLDGGLLCDVTLSAGAHSVRAHRLVLATCSAYFLQLFQEMRNTQHPVVVLHNVNIEDVRAVLAFMYKGQCVVSREQLPSLLSVAKLLKVQGLCDMKVPDNELSPTDIEQTDELNTFRNTADKCDTEVNEYLDSINLKRQSDDTVQATDLSNRSKRLKLSSPTFWPKDNLPITPESNPYTPEEQLCPPFKKTPKDSSETCKCFLCGKYLSNQYNLRVHMETHEEAYHACRSCPHVSRSRDALRKHVSYRHPEEYHTRKRKKTDAT